MKGNSGDLEQIRQQKTITTTGGVSRAVCDITGYRFDRAVLPANTWVRRAMP